MRITILLVPILLAGCARAYVLPEPPPPDERGAVALDPAEEQRLSDERYLDARRAVLGLYAALEGEEWGSAAELLSHETRLLLAGDGGDAEAALATGRVEVGGVTFGFDPVDLLLLPNVVSFEDTIDGEEEVETSRRKEVFLVGDEETRRVVVIEEAGAWRVHARRLPRARLTAAASR